MLRVLLIAAAAALAVAIFPSRVWGGGDEAHVQYTRAGDLSEGEPVKESYRVVKPMERLEVELDLELSAGSVAWKLTDPEGAVRWQGSVEAGGSVPDGKKSFEAVDGEWTLTLAPQSADGRYRLRWRGDS